MIIISFVCQDSLTLPCQNIVWKPELLFVFFRDGYPKVLYKAEIRVFEAKWPKTVFSSLFCKIKEQTHLPVPTV